MSDDQKSFVLPVDEEKRKLQLLKFNLYTDGSCCLQNANEIPTVASSKFSGPGGWAALIIDAKERRTVICGKDPSTTNNRMEMAAVIQGIQWIIGGIEPEILKHVHINLYSDSTYCVNTIRSWLETWKKNHADFSNRPNADLLRELDALVSRCKVKPHWVPRCSTENMTLVDSVANIQRLEN
jgi:ribonuclease HI